MRDVIILHALAIKDPELHPAQMDRQGHFLHLEEVFVPCHSLNAPNIPAMALGSRLWLEIEVQLPAV
jgi:hypothetical protein